MPLTQEEQARIDALVDAEAPVERLG
jgi:hypothetical protein